MQAEASYVVEYLSGYGELPKRRCKLVIRSSFLEITGMGLKIPYKDIKDVSMFKPSKKDFIKSEIEKEPMMALVPFIALGEALLQPLCMRLEFWDRNGSLCQMIFDIMDNKEIQSHISQHLTEIKSKESPQEEDVVITPEERYDKLKDILLQYSNKIKHNKILFAPDIPEKKLANAIKHYARIQEGERPLVLYDDTTFGSAKAGLLVTDQRVYWREPMSKPGSLAIKEIQNTNFKRDWTGSILYINNTKVLTATQIGKNEVGELTKLIEQMALRLRSIQ